MHVIDLFAGVGGWSEGARQAGHEIVSAVEHNELAVEFYIRNHGAHVVHADILSLDPNEFPSCDLLLASPPCPNFSVAKAGGKETEQDIALARKVAEFITTLRPRYVFLENVYAYRKSQSWAIVQDALSEAGYWYDINHLNSADFGVPQTRKRMIVRATRGMLPPVANRENWIGWYAAIEDLLNTLPDSEFADWQMARLPENFEDFLLGAGTYTFPRFKNQPAQTITSNHNQIASVKAFLIGGGNTGFSTAKPMKSVRLDHQPAMTVRPNDDGGHAGRAFLVSSQNGTGKASSQKELTIRMMHEPANTVTASANKAQSRAWLGRGRVVSMTPAALARFQSFPDAFIFPDVPSHATRLIGNAVPPKMAKALLEGLA